ncbi:hypothetical protein HYX07_05640, partial [Candidatus Woesearchaeota archaeon]|nr:hypothetical protein [Candidatus Woesearchaeota archaeon]
MTQRPHKIELWMFLAAVVILGAGIYFLGPSITGFVIKEFSYTDDLNLVITSSGNYTWNLQSIGDLKSALIDGRVTNSGKARVYIESDGKRYLIFDSARIGENKQAGIIESNEPGNSITGFATKGKDDDKDKDDDESDEDKKKKNHEPEWDGPSQFTINGTTLLNLS